MEFRALTELDAIDCVPGKGHQLRDGLGAPRCKDPFHIEHCIAHVWNLLGGSSHLVSGL